MSGVHNENNEEQLNSDAVYDAMVKAKISIDNLNSALEILLNTLRERSEQKLKDELLR